MEATKTKFQALLTEIERLLEDFKNAYPKNYGAMIQQRIPVFMLIMAVLWVVYILYSRYNELLENAWWAPVILIFLFLKYSKETTPADSSQLEQKVRAAKDKFGEYHDALVYLEKTDGEIATEKARKKHIKIVVRCVFWGMITVATVFTARHAYNLGSSGYVPDKLWFEWFSDDMFYRVLEYNRAQLDFLSIKPLKTEVSDSVNITPEKIKMAYFGYYFGTELWGTIPVLQTDDFWHHKFFLVTITDLNGNPVPKCPDFLIYSNYEEMGATLPVHSDAEKLQLLYYLQENQDSLRFVVEEL